MRIVVTGCRGMLGSEVMSAASKAGHEVHGRDLPELDIVSAPAARALLADLRPDVVINCAAKTDVDGCEKDRDGAFSVNAVGAGNLASACHGAGLKLIHISTDYVFDGSKREPYYEYDAPAPVNVYGMSKLHGERLVASCCPASFIVRTSWLFGKNGPSFVRAISRRARETGSLSVVVDQWGSPTYAADLAVFLLELAKTSAFGIYHATNEGFCTWYDFAREIVTLSGLGHVPVTGITSDRMSRPAKRPLNSMLYKTALKAAGFGPLPPWSDAIARYISDCGGFPA